MDDKDDGDPQGDGRVWRDKFFLEWRLISDRVKGSFICLYEFYVLGFNLSDGDTGSGFSFRELSK